MDLAYSELLGDANKVNQEVEKYRSVTIDEIKSVARKMFDKKNSSTLYYLAKK